ncbi:MAG: molybdenum ABC transporter ATP-binding protein [Proteobacteria bacterium]|nr:molybdenum ABC transporter ATP-binding protein [Pseudomonadota bacterium]
MSGIQARLLLTRPDFSLDLDLELPGRGVTALFGPSGCGKTSCLRALAGLERTQGSVRVNGELWQDDATGHWLPTHRRQLGYVFQEASLFAHLNVQRNMEYGLRRLPAARRRVSLDQAVELLGLGALLPRMPHTLSGGERQRVAIARALAASPRVLLMDEPLAALDAARKAEVMPYLERLQRSLDIPMLYVSHSCDEVARLASRLVLMQAGRVMAQGPTAELMARLDLPMAHGDAAAALVQGRVAAYDAQDQLLTVTTAGGRIQLASANPRAAGERLHLRVLARDVSLARTRAPDSSILNLLPVRITRLTNDAPGQVLVALDMAGTQLLSRITQRSCRMLALGVGDEVFAQIKGVALVD